MSKGSQFFDLKSPRDMLEKARREFTKLQADLNTDNVFNFVITVNHIRDYAEDYGIPKNRLPKGADFQLCRDLCNMAKHLESGYTYKDNKFSQESVKLWAEGLWAEGLWDGKQSIFEFEGQQLNMTHGNEVNGTGHLMSRGDKASTVFSLRNLITNFEGENIPCLLLMRLPTRVLNIQFLKESFRSFMGPQPMN